MLLMPRKVKYRKAQKGKNRGIATRGAVLNFGEFGLKALENGIVRGNHMEASRLAIARKTRGVRHELPARQPLVMQTRLEHHRHELIHRAHDDGTDEPEHEQMGDGENVLVVMIRRQNVRTRDEQAHARE